MLDVTAVPRGQIVSFAWFPQVAMSAKVEISTRDNLADQENRCSANVIHACDIAPPALHIASQ